MTTTAADICKSRKAPLVARIRRARNELPKVSCKLNLPDSDLLQKAGDLDEKFRVPGQSALQALLVPSLDSWMGNLAMCKIRLLSDNQLLNEAASAELIKCAKKITSCEDSFEIKLMKDAIPEIAARVLCNNPETGFRRAGNIIIQEKFEETNHPYWGPEDPAYTSRRWELLVGVIG